MHTDSYRTTDRRSKRDFRAQIAAAFLGVHERVAAGKPVPIDELTDAAAEYMPGAQFVGITAIDGRGRITTPAATADYPRMLDAVQGSRGQGPSLQAVLNHNPVHITDLNAEVRWPHFRGDALAQTPIRSILSFAMSVHQNTMGTLNFYAERPHAFGEESAELGHLIATHAALAWRAMRREAQFISALASRDVIGQAKGMLIERHGLDSSKAFDLLRQLSQESNVPVAQIAQKLVEADHPTLTTSGVGTA